MNTKTNARKIAILAVMAGLSVAFVFIIRFPIFPPPYDFYEYDPADIPVLISTFAYGPLAGLIVAVVASVVQGVTVSARSGFFGIIMHILSTGSLVLTAGLVYKYKRTRAGAAIGLAGGVLVSTAIMAAANLIITPLFMSVHIDVVKAMLWPVIIPFNLIKAGINSILTFILYKRISKLIKSSWELEIKDIDRDISGITDIGNGNDDG